ncbi:DUF4136 domain-containing protein [Stutzerimonas urumqiensis]|uniref:DUF4136 domain-containing protein n=1 Tax=Stutzerimonas urumqiensis TaxID=638269 RepID=UPI000EB0AC41|nr:DUF4136 domain-containing protein [Stutzerimonas urumqiensis]
MKRLALIGLAVLLAACQTTQVERDFDPSRDFSSYRQWSWREPAVRYQPDDPRLKSDLTEQRIRDAVSQQLDQRGLRPAPAGSEGDLEVQTWMIVDDREQQVTTHYNSMIGPWYGYWGGPGIVESRTLDYQVGTLQIDLYDSRDGKLVWRGSTSRILPADRPGPRARAEAINQTVAEVLSQYPPK